MDSNAAHQQRNGKAQNRGMIMVTREPASTEPVSTGDLIQGIADCVPPTDRPDMLNSRRPSKTTEGTTRHRLTYTHASTSGILFTSAMRLEYPLNLFAVCGDSALDVSAALDASLKSCISNGNSMPMEVD